MPRLQQILGFIDRSRYPLWATYIGVGMLIGLLEALAGLLFLGLLATFNGADASVGRLVSAVRAMTGGADPVIGMAVLVIVVYLIKSVATLAQVYLRSYCVDDAFVARFKARRAAARCCRLRCAGTRAYGGRTTHGENARGRC